MKALISTISPISGGVPRMAAFVADTLSAGGIEPVIAYYQPYSITPALSVPAYTLLQRKPSARQADQDGRRQHAIGAWLPELEFTHYLPTRPWKALIEECDFHLSVSGNCLAATPFALRGIPYWAWVATTWHEDREQRVARHAWPRRMLDRLINQHGARRLERKILSNGTIMALSDYTRGQIQQLTGGRQTVDVMPMAIDTDHFKPGETKPAKRQCIGFVGRLSDPRKNAGLLLETLAWCRNQGHQDLELVAIGDDDASLRRAIEERGLQSRVTLLDNVDNAALPRYLNDMDVFVIPSHQEGLCIAALEAMSCGVPVVTTPCGGPEQFVIDNETGFIAGFRPESLGAAILNILKNSALHDRLADNVRSLIERDYAISQVQTKFWESFNCAFNRQSACATTFGATTALP